MWIFGFARMAQILTIQTADFTRQQEKALVIQATLLLH
jgi:hypothetical protein